MGIYKTNIFCIISNIGSNQDVYLEKILGDKSFIKKTRLSRLIYNTTKPMNKIQDDNTKYHFYTEEEYRDISQDNIIEYRSYYTIPYETIYYFTLVDDIHNKENVICITSPYQYENYKRWITVENMRDPYSYNLFAIFIHCNMENRFRNTISSLNLRNDNETNLLEFARRILQDNYEFEDTKKRIPELMDPMNCNNTCYIDDDNVTELEFKANLLRIKTFILDKVNINSIYP